MSLQTWHIPIAAPKQFLPELRRQRSVADRRIVKRIFEWYENSDEKECLCSEPNLNRVGYASEISWQMKELDDE
jgi:hypothetical protein